MNKIEVRTHQGEYFAGDIVYGVIYLKVATVDFCETIQLQISGLEQCEYIPSEEDDWSITHPNHCLRNPFSDKLMSNPVEIYAPTEPIAVGSYKFPFQYRLKPTLPRTTSIKSSCGKWQGSVFYVVTASCSSSKELTATQHFVCFGRKYDDLVKVGYCQESVIKTCFCYDRGRISLLTELNKSVYTIGESIGLEVTVHNNSSETIKSVNCWLNRTVKLYGLWVQKETERTSDSFVIVNDTIRGANHVRLQDEVAFDAETIRLENLGTVPPKMNQKWKFHMHLSSEDGSVLSPTTQGTYVKIKYCVLVHVAVPRSSDLIVTVPIAHVLPSQNKEWLEWQPGPWMTNCQMPPRHDKLAVQKSILESPVYEGLL